MTFTIDSYRQGLVGPGPRPTSKQIQYDRPQTKARIKNSRRLGPRSTMIMCRVTYQLNVLYRTIPVTPYFKLKVVRPVYQIDLGPTEPDMNKIGPY